MSVRAIFSYCGNFATNSGSRCDQISDASLPAGKVQSLVGASMRTAISQVALPPVVWQPAFVPDTSITNWSGRSGLILTWAADKGLTVVGGRASSRGSSPPFKAMIRFSENCCRGALPRHVVPPDQLYEQRPR